MNDNVYGSKYVRVDTPGGLIWVEIEATASAGEYIQAGTAETARKAIKAFEDTLDVLKQNAQKALIFLRADKAFRPDEIEMSFGINVGVDVEASTYIFCQAKASGEASYTITLKWKRSDEEVTD